MAESPNINFNFSKGFLPDGGPFFASEGYIKDGLNCTIQRTGEIDNRLGLQLLSENTIRPFDDRSDVTNNFLSSMYYTEVTKNDGSILELIFLNWGQTVLVYANDGGTFTNSIENIGANFNAADFVFTLSDFSDEAWYYKSRWEQEGNAVIMVSPMGPIYKFVWGDITTGSETLTSFRVELSEYNDKLFGVPRAATLGKSVPGWFCTDIPTKTGQTVYTVLDFAADAVPGYVTTVFRIDSSGHHTLQTLTTDYTYAETIDTSINIVTATLTLVSAFNTGEIFRVYFGPDTLPNFDASLAREEIIVSNKTKDFNVDDSHSPSKAVMFGGRIWFLDVNGPLDVTDDATFDTLGPQPKKIWVSDIFNSSLKKEEITHIKARQVKSPFDKDDNFRTPTEGNVILLDNAAKILDAAAYKNSLYIAATNGLWAITAPDEFFALNQLRIEKIIDGRFVSKECLSSTDTGIIAWGESEVYFIAPDPKGEQDPVTRLALGAIYSFYNKIDIELKRRGFARYDSFNKRAYWFYPSTVAIAASKFGAASVGDKALCFDTQLTAWQPPIDYSAGDFLISDMVTVPSKAFFPTSDFRNEEYRKVNLVLLVNKNGTATDSRLGILEGKPYCADFFGSTVKKAYSSFVENNNVFAVADLGVGRKKQVARLYLSFKRQERDDADGSGFYEYPGACYLQRRWRHADNENAGPLFDHKLNSGQTAWVEQRRQVYFPFRYGAIALGGLKPGYEVIPFETKLRGRGEVIRLRFGNHFGNTDLTGTIEEQEKGWGLFGYEITLGAER